jgi:DNA-binding NtrC family response regulator
MSNESAHGIRPRILLVDPDEITRTVLQDRLSVEGFTPIGVGNADAAARRLVHEPFDFVVFDTNEDDGLALLSAAARTETDADFIMVAPEAVPGAGMEALRRGAYDYLPAPLRTDELLFTLRRARREREQRMEIASLRARLGVGARGRILGRTPVMKRLIDEIERVAATDRNVLVVGEQGTGKELVARAVHDLSSRAGRPLVAIRCAAMPVALAEAELFGETITRNGGRITSRRGLIEAVRGGTLFLDDIEAMPAGARDRLLRVLVERRVQRIGSRISTALDYRVVATTNQDAGHPPGAGLPPDFLHRLNAIAIVVPPLRERTDDIPILADHFRQRYARENDIEAPPIPAQTLARLARHGWSGNVTELERWAQRESMHGSGETDAERGSDGPREGHTDGILSGAVAGEWSLRRLEEEYIAEVLDRTDGHQGRAAAILGIDRRTLYRKLKRLRRPGHSAS